jgi:enoyl-CoA hydratase/carnithine racemase
MGAAVRAERDGRVLVVFLDQQFIDRQMVDELTVLVRKIRRDTSIGALIITGARPGHFATHYDITEMLDGSERARLSMPVSVAGIAGRTVAATSRIPGTRRTLRRTPLAGVLDLDATGALFRSLERLDKVVIAAINGPALGAACELALTCDLRYIASDAGAIGTPELTQGYGPGAGGTQRHARALGPASALELILEARMPSPQEALALGLVHRVLPAEQLLDEARTAAHRLARRAPVSVAGAKQAIYERSPAVERSWFMAALSRPAARRAMRQYVDELHRDGRGAWETDETFAAWQNGTAVDLVD